MKFSLYRTYSRIGTVHCISTQYGRCGRSNIVHIRRETYVYIYMIARMFKAVPSMSCTRSSAHVLRHVQPFTLHSLYSLLYSELLVPGSVSK